MNLRSVSVIRRPHIIGRHRHEQTSLERRTLRVMVGVRPERVCEQPSSRILACSRPSSSVMAPPPWTPTSLAVRFVLTQERASADGLRKCDPFDARNDCSNEMGVRAHPGMAAFVPKLEGELKANDA